MRQNKTTEKTLSNLERANKAIEYLTGYYVIPDDRMDNDKDFYLQSENNKISETVCDILRKNNFYPSLFKAVKGKVTLTFWDTSFRKNINEVSQ